MTNPTYALLCDTRQAQQQWGDHRLNGPLGWGNYSGPLVHSSTRAGRARGRSSRACDREARGRATLPPAGVIECPEAKRFALTMRVGRSSHGRRPHTHQRAHPHGRRTALAPRGGRRQGRPDRGAGERGGGRRVVRSAHADRGPRRPPRPARLRRRAPAPVVRHRGALRGAPRGLPVGGGVPGPGGALRRRASRAAGHSRRGLVPDDGPHGRHDGRGARPRRARPSRLHPRRQRPRAVGQQRPAAARRRRPGRSRLGRRRRRAPPRRRAQGAAPRGLPLGRPRAPPVHRRAEEPGAAVLPAGARGALRHDARP